jgi:hypothetical protein
LTFLSLLVVVVVLLGTVAAVLVGIELTLLFLLQLLQAIPLPLVVEARGLPLVVLLVAFQGHLLYLTLLRLQAGALADTTEDRMEDLAAVVVMVHELVALVTSPQHLPHKAPMVVAQQVLLILAPVVVVVQALRGEMAHLQQVATEDLELHQVLLDLL